MSDVLDEHEQGEKVRKWLHENGSSILIGLALGAAAILGVGKYQEMRGARYAEASDKYVALTEAIEKKDDAAIKALSDSMRTTYAKSPYSVLAAIDESARLTADGKLDDAAKALAFARDNSGTMPELGQLAAIRLARLQLAQDKPDDALKSIAGVTNKGYQALAAEIRGDALFAQKKYKEAQAAYDDSLTHFDATSPRRTIVEMKRDDLATIAEGT
ncbi:hypothetical protein C7S18_13695 [Ahniella affigens]|uniref:Ancillary SecYEG translocon subunit/Cell division coordinator CpoB TPR domain-containing protein n=1 Tax=Ahniella affigens TaxID=2021234 RepID=A0A2P1PTM5_9GAMM|nr:tetratricopeptide repeat protein [Ahniella affigens]AVP98181.1 hypothetical protein C7S18_13695 [Ahniella affigens]